MLEPFGIFTSGFLRRRQTFLTALGGTISGSPGGDSEVTQIRWENRR